MPGRAKQCRRGERCRRGKRDVGSSSAAVIPVAGLALLPSLRGDPRPMRSGRHGIGPDRALERQHLGHFPRAGPASVSRASRRRGQLGQKCVGGRRDQQSVRQPNADPALQWRPRQAWRAAPSPGRFVSHISRSFAALIRTNYPSSRTESMKGRCQRLPSADKRLRTGVRGRRAWRSPAGREKPPRGSDPRTGEPPGACEPAARANPPHGSRMRVARAALGYVSPCSRTNRSPPRWSSSAMPSARVRTSAAISDGLPVPRCSQSATPARKAALHRPRRAAPAAGI